MKTTHVNKSIAFDPTIFDAIQARAYSEGKVISEVVNEAIASAYNLGHVELKFNKPREYRGSVTLRNQFAEPLLHKADVSTPEKLAAHKASENAKLAAEYEARFLTLPPEYQSIERAWAAEYPDYQRLAFDITTCLTEGLYEKVLNGELPDPRKAK